MAREIHRFSIAVKAPSPARALVRSRLLLFGLDVDNATNANPVVAVNSTYNAVASSRPSGAWLAPQSILTARFVKISVSMDF